MSEGRAEAGAQEEQLPQAGPGAAVLLEDQRQLERGHHAAVAHHPLQAPAAFVHLQVHVKDAAAQPARLPGRQPQDLPGDAPRQRLRNQNRGAVQRGLLGAWQAAFQHGGQTLAAPVLSELSVPLGVHQAVIPEIQFWEQQGHSERGKMEQNQREDDEPGLNSQNKTTQIKSSTLRINIEF